MTEQLDPKRLIQNLLSKGWSWSDRDEGLLLHPHDHNIYVRYDRDLNTLSISSAMAAALDLVIPTSASQSKRFWRDDQKAYKASRT